MAGKFAPQIWGEASLQLSEFGELERGLPDFSKHVRSGECVKTRNRGGHFTGSIINDRPKWKKRAKKNLCTESSANTAPKASFTSVLHMHRLKPHSVPNVIEVRLHM